jgi:hypothetical protein
MNITRGMGDINLSAKHLIFYIFKAFSPVLDRFRKNYIKKVTTH